MDYRYKDTIAVPREYAITSQGQEFLMFTLYWIACHVEHENTPALYEQCSHTATKSEIQKPIQYVTIHS